MAKNRKTKAPPEVLAVAAKVTVICLLIGGAALGYVWQREQIYQLGKQYRKLEQEHERSVKAHRELQLQLMKVSSRSELAARARMFQLGLEEVSAQQTVHLAEPGLAREDRAAGAGVSGGEGRGGVVVADAH